MKTGIQDVYKRQGWSWPRAIRAPSSAAASQGIAMRGSIACRWAHKHSRRRRSSVWAAVSYTHLDVYKRQAEYGMLPRATHTRSGREAARGKQTGRTQEIQRLIGRALRAVLDLKGLGERTVTIDCDVLQADGGTRTAAITGGFVALADAIDTLLKRRAIQASPLHGQVAAVSVGIYRGQPVLDLDYAEDSNAETDMNLSLIHI